MVTVHPGKGSTHEDNGAHEAEKEIMATPMSRTPGLMALVALVAVQGVLAFLRANHWFHAGADLLGHGLLIIPLAGVVAIGRGGLVAALGVLYLLFAVGALWEKNWAWWTGLFAALLNLLLVLSIVLQGESIWRALLWVAVPIILLCYLFMPQRGSSADERLAP
jgi:hypothetical protein